MTGLAAVILTTGLVQAAEPSSVIDVHVSGGVLVPVEHTGTVPVGALSVGTWVKEDLAVRLRMLGAPPPVPEDGVASDAFTWGVMAELQKAWGIHPRLDPFWTVSAGFVASDRQGSEESNLTSFAVHGGLGFEARLQPDDENRGWTVSPVLGIAPQLLTEDRLIAFVGPTAEVRLGRAW